MSLINLLKRFKRPILFTTPSHSGKGFGRFAKLLGRKIFQYDFSEIEGLDNIREPEGVFLKSQKRAAEIYDSKASFYLFNGSTSGILALILATVAEGDKVLTTKNAHVSIFNGIKLVKAEPVFLELEQDKKFDVPKPIYFEKFKQILSDDIKVVIITSPSYEGVVSDMVPIAKLCKERGVFLIVDESHGALWDFSDKLPAPAIKCGADATVQSLHKTAGALTQASIMHISKDSVLSSEKVQECLNMINTTSPSYLLLASAESSVEFLASRKKHGGQKELQWLLLRIEKTRERLSQIEGVELLSTPDITKIFLSIKGLSGHELSAELMKHNIEDELCNDKGVLLLCGIGTSKKKLQKLENAVGGIAISERN